MDSIKDIASWLSQLGKDENHRNAAGALIGTAVSNSKDGAVAIQLSGDVLQNDGSTEGGTFTVPTTETIAAGDSVIVTLLGDGALKDPIATSAAGAGGNKRVIPLYDGGYTTGNITLSDSIANYKAIQVFWKPPTANHPIEGCVFLPKGQATGDIRMSHIMISSSSNGLYIDYQYFTYDRDVIKPSFGQRINNSKALQGGSAGNITTGTCIGGIVQVNGILW